MSPEKLAYMANQISRNIASLRPPDPVAEVQDHLLKYWEPRMRAALLAHLDEVQLDPLTRSVLDRLKGAQTGLSRPA